LQELYGLAFERVNVVTISSDKPAPSRAISYVELPKWTKNKKACINLRNRISKCFMKFVYWHYNLLKEVHSSTKAFLQITERGYCDILKEEDKFNPKAQQKILIGLRT
jgi:hypothetical protein